MELKERDCRKIHLHNLHLNIPTLEEISRNRNLRHTLQEVDAVEQGNYSEFDSHLSILSNLIADACKGNSDKLKLLKTFLRWDFFIKSAYDRMPPSFTNCFLDCMHPGLEDSEFVLECLKKLNFKHWLLSSEPLKAERFENLLFQIHRIASRIICPACLNDLLVYCIVHPSFELTKQVMNFQCAPRFCDNLLDFYKNEICHSNAVKFAFPLRFNMSRRRYFLLLQVFWVYLEKSVNPQAASEFFGSIWSSVPDSLLSSDEIALAYYGIFSSEKYADVHSLYSEAVGASNPYVEPRSLKHYCRTTIRGRLSQLRCWLPDGIRELGLPKTLQSYLELKC